MAPCILGAARDARAEIACGFQVAALLEMAMSHGEPGPERGRVLRDRRPQGRLRPCGITTGQKRGAEHGQVAALGWSDLSGADAVAGGQIGIPERGMVAGSLGEQHRWDRGVKPLGLIEVRNRPYQSSSPVVLRTAMTRDDHSGTSLQYEQLDNLPPQPPGLLGLEAQQPLCGQFLAGVCARRAPARPAVVSSAIPT